MGPTRKKPSRLTVVTAGTPTSQKALTPDRKASSVVTRIEVAPNQEAVRERRTSEAGRDREARKKASKPVILRENFKPIRSRATK
jgi:hypothetical protein